MQLYAARGAVLSVGHSERHDMLRNAPEEGEAFYGSVGCFMVGVRPPVLGGRHESAVCKVLSSTLVDSRSKRACVLGFVANEQRGETLAYAASLIGCVHMRRRGQELVASCIACRQMFERVVAVFLDAHRSVADIRRYLQERIHDESG